MFRKTEIELTAQHIEVIQDVVLNCNAEMSVHLISLFVTCGLEESMLRPFLLSHTLFQRLFDCKENVKPIGKPGSYLKSFGVCREE